MNRSLNRVHTPEVLGKVDARTRTPFADVHEGAAHEQGRLREAAHLIAVERVARAYRERGWV